MPTIFLFFLAMCAASFALFCMIACLLSPELIGQLKRSVRLWQARHSRSERFRVDWPETEREARAIERVLYFD